jgi:hypothetical protein
MPLGLVGEALFGTVVVDHKGVSACQEAHITRSQALIRIRTA